MIEKYRVHEVAKDLNIPSKDLISLLEENFPGEPKKHMTALTDAELNLVFDKFTRDHSTASLDSYFALKNEKPKAKPAPVAQEKPAPAQPPKAAAEAPAAPQPPKTAPAAPAAAPAPQKPQESHAAAPAPQKPAAPAAQEKPAAPAPQEKPAAPAAQEKPAAPAAQEKPAAPAAQAAPAAPQRPAAPAPQKPAAQSGSAQQPPRPARPVDPAVANFRPGQRTYNNRTTYGGQSSQGGDRRSFGGQNQGQNQGRFGSQGDRRSFGQGQNQGRSGSQGDRRPFGQQSRPQSQPQQQAPAAPPKPVLPPQGTPIEIKMPQKQKGPKGERQAPVTVTNVVVDMRTSEVNLDKYNERYEQIAPTSAVKDNIVKKQKLNQRSQRKGKPFMSRKEREDQKMRHLEMERQRRQKLEVTLPEEMTVGELAAILKVQASEIIKRLMPLGVMAAVNDTIDYDTAALVAMEIGAKVSKEVVVTIEDRLFDETEDTDENLQPRSPIVVVMGHVDHGKTSLLDAIRHTNVVSGEAGGITQHIGAYQVEVNGRPITFLDTPGHAAFTAMRARGAQVTDIAVLVVAADDGIMPQTVEAINHAKDAGVSIIVAINKMDKPHANPDKVKQQLTEYGLVPEEWGGDVICVPVSAKTHQGIDTLLENLLLVADIKELKANPDRMARGTVIEARLDKGRGPVATVLVQTGTLHAGDIIIAGTAVGRVRVMINDKGERVETAGPSVPVEITGLADVPAAGDQFNAVEDEKLARELVEQRREEAKQQQFSSYQKVTLDNLFEHISQEEVIELPIIVKADVQGSVEAVKQSLEKLSNDEVRVRVIHGAVGAVSESDVMLAAASGAIIVGFNVRPDPIAKENAERDGVEIHLYRIIYDAIEDVEAAMKGMLAPKTKEVDLGRAEVRQVYNITGVGKVAGCYVLEGKIARGANIRLVRDGIIITDVKLASLRRFKDDVKEVAAGYECGITLEKTADLKEGDIFEAYEIQEIKD
jgi:translation initiation factor IF-2